jgi:hypothetical protein
MKKYHDIKDVKVVNNKLILLIDKKIYEFDIDRISDKLKSAKEHERNNFTISSSGYGIHWPLIDEDISIDGLLRQKIRDRVKTKTSKSE